MAGYHPSNLLNPKMSNQTRSRLSRDGVESSRKYCKSCPVRLSQSQNKSKACKSLNLQAFLFLYYVKSLQFALTISEQFS